MDERENLRRLGFVFIFLGSPFILLALPFLSEGETEGFGIVLFYGLLFSGLIAFVPGLVLVLIASIRRSNTTDNQYKVYCPSCRKPFVVRRVRKFSCPICKMPLEWSIQCELCQRQFPSSDPSNKVCPDCEIL